MSAIITSGVIAHIVNTFLPEVDMSAQRLSDAAYDELQEFKAQAWAAMQADISRAEGSLLHKQSAAIAETARGLETAWDDYERAASVAWKNFRDRIRAKTRDLVQAATAAEEVR